MIDPGTLQYEVRRRIEKVGSEFNKKFGVAAIDSYLNEALQIWFKTKVRLAETSAEVRDEIRQVEVKKKELEVEVVEQDSTCFKAVYPSNFYKRLKVSAILGREGCEDKKAIIHIFQTDDLDEALKSPSWKPSFEYEELIADEAGNGLFLYTDGTFKILKVFMDYYRKPLEIKSGGLVEGGYEASSGKVVTDNQGLELDSLYQYSDITDIAALVALRDQGKVEDYQTQLDKIFKLKT